MVIGRALNRLLNKLRHNLHHIGYLVYLLQRLPWQPTIALSTCDSTYHTSIMELIMIRHSCLFPAKESEAYWVLLTLPNVIINQTHHAKAETIHFDQGVPTTFCFTRDWLQVPLNCILVIVCPTCQSHSCNCRI